MLNSPRPSLRPFRTAASVMGSVVLFLALLIRASRFYIGNRRNNNSQMPYVWRNIMCLAGILVFMFLGLTSGLDGVSNTATVFLVLFLVDKYAEFHMDMEWSGWVLVLLMSLIMWRSALWLHAHPGIIASMFEVL